MLRKGQALTSPWALALGAGILYALGFAPVAWWPLVPAGMGLYFAALLRSQDGKEAIGISLLMKTVSVAPTLSYLWGVSPGVHAAVAAVFLGTWAGLGAAFHGFRTRYGAGAAFAALPFLWTLCEWISNVLHFLPSHITTAWAALAVPGLPLAPHAGLYGVDFYAALLAASPGLAFLALWRPEERPSLGASVAVLAAAALAPALLKAAGPDGPPAKPLSLRVAAASLLPNDELEEHLERGAWTPERRAAVAAHLERRLAELRALLGSERPDLIVLPEDAIDFTLSEDRSEEAARGLGIENNGLLLAAYRRLARETRAEVVAGLTTLRGGARRNSVLLVGPDGALRGLRDKFHLTPASERWPLRPLPLWLLFAGGGRFVEPEEQYSRSEEPFRLLPLRAGPAGASVCLEGQMPSMYLGWSRAGARLVLFLTNAHWFQADPAGYNGQVLGLVRLAAAAYGLPVVLTGKASYAGWVDDRGRADVRPGFGPETPERFRILDIFASGRRTLAAHYGEYFVLLSLAGLAAGAALAHCARRRAAIY